MVILYPTDTIYGLGVDATDPEAVLRLRELKGRDEKKPISIVVRDLAMAEEYAVVTPLARRLAEKFLPGKISIILEAKGNLPEGITAGTGTVAIRIPDHPVPRELVGELGKPLTATSANVADMSTMPSAQEILTQFGDKASMITRVIDAGMLPESMPSTVVDARGETPAIIRAGAVSTTSIMSVSEV